MKRGPDEGPCRYKYARMAEIGQRGDTWITPQVYKTSLAKWVGFRTFDAHPQAGRINLSIYL